MVGRGTRTGEELIDLFFDMMGVELDAHLHREMLVLCSGATQT